MKTEGTLILQKEKDLKTKQMAVLNEQINRLDELLAL
jgi:hypothetical protein